MPGSEFVVSRTARKDNSSDYHINGHKVPFKEVARLLKDCGIDLDHNRFLILQVSYVTINATNIFLTLQVVWQAPIRSFSLIKCTEIWISCFTSYSDARDSACSLFKENQPLFVWLFLLL